MRLRLLYGTAVFIVYQHTIPGRSRHYSTAIVLYPHGVDTLLIKRSIGLCHGDIERPAPAADRSRSSRDALLYHTVQQHSPAREFCDTAVYWYATTVRTSRPFYKPLFANALHMLARQSLLALRPQEIHIVWYLVFIPGSILRLLLTAMISYHASVSSRRITSYHT